MIKAVMFDMGGTIEDLYNDEKNDVALAQKLMTILNAHGITTPFGDDADGLWKVVKAGYTAGKREAEKTMQEFKPEVIWPDWAFRDVPADREKLIACSEEIAHMWELTNFDRSMRPRTEEMLKGLRELGLKISVISNTGSLFQVFDTLNDYGIRQYFDDITLSSVTGYRKPHPYIFTVALKQLNLKPEECVYVGDTTSRDVVGPRKMGYGLVIKIRSFLTAQKDIGNFAGFEPDYEITDIYDVYTIMKNVLGK